jgi:hypothetical protein
MGQIPFADLVLTVYWENSYPENVLPRAMPSAAHALLVQMANSDPADVFRLPLKTLSALIASSVLQVNSRPVDAY